MRKYGYIHSKETYGALDGPGIRYVLFMQGCPLHCLFCHNPDTWNMNEGKRVSTDEVLDDILKYRSFIKKGGVTLSGGEPLLQAEFCAELFVKCKAAGIHTAIDTSGNVPLNDAKKVIDETDLVLLDIKSLDNELCRKITGSGNENALNMLKYCEEIGKDVWIRHVLVPGITLNRELLDDLAEYLRQFTCISRIELLPFHKLGEYKWKQLKIQYTLEDTREPTKEEIQMAEDIFRKKGFEV